MLSYRSIWNPNCSSFSSSWPAPCGNPVPMILGGHWGISLSGKNKDQPLSLSPRPTICTNLHHGHTSRKEHLDDHDILISDSDAQSIRPAKIRSTSTADQRSSLLWYQALGYQMTLVLGRQSCSTFLHWEQMYFVRFKQEERLAMLTRFRSTVDSSSNIWRRKSISMHSFRCFSNRGK